MVTTSISAHPKDASDKQGWWQSLKNGVNAAFAGIVNYIKSPFDGLTHYGQNKENPDSVKLNALREKFNEQITHERLKPQPDINRITKNITAETKKYLQNIIAEEVKNAGTPPCKFAINTLGSMARQESGPITDLEIGFIIEKKTPETYRYFYKLAQNISDRFFLLGEHPDIGGKGLRPDEAGNFPPHLRFFARNSSRQEQEKLLNEAISNREWDKIPFGGSRSFLATPEEWASYSDPNYKQDKQQLANLRHDIFEKEWTKAINDPKNKAKLKTEKGKNELQDEIRFWIAQMYRPYSSRELKIAKEVGTKLGRNMDRLYGDSTVFNKFINKREENFNKAMPNGNTYRKNIAKEKMIYDLYEQIQKGKSPFLTGKLGKTFDLKREGYRFVEQFLTNLGFYHKCKSQNCIDIANELVARKIISPDLGVKLVDFTQFITGLKLKEQTILKRQGFAVYIDQAEFDEDKKDLEEKIQRLEATIEFMDKIPNQHADNQVIHAKNRELVKLKNEYDHLLDMAPGKILSKQDIKAIEQNLPVMQEIFEAAKQWSSGQETLGFKPSPAKAPTPAPVAIKPKLVDSVSNDNKAAVDSVAKQPGGIFLAFNALRLKQKELQKNQAINFLEKYKALKNKR